MNPSRALALQEESVEYLTPQPPYVTVGELAAAVFIGDARAAVPPNLAQGAAVAIEDAVDLAAVLGQHFAAAGGSAREGALEAALVEAKALEERSTLTKQAATERSTVDLEDRLAAERLAIEDGR